MTAEDLLKAADLKRVIPEAAAAPTAQLQSNEKEILSRQRTFVLFFGDCRFLIGLLAIPPLQVPKPSICSIRNFNSEGAFCP